MSHSSKKRDTILSLPDDYAGAGSSVPAILLSALFFCILTLPLFAEPETKRKGKTKIFTAAGNGEVHRVNASGDGSLFYDGYGAFIWDLASDEEHNLYVGGEKNEIHCVNPEGERVWTYDGHTSTVTGITIAGNGDIISTDISGRIHRIDSAGDRKWTFQVEGEIRGSPAVNSEGYIYAGTSRGALHRLSPDGKREWTYSGHVGRVYAVHPGEGGHVYSGARELHKLDRSGHPVWKFNHFDTPHTIRGITLDDEGFVYSAGNNNNLIYRVRDAGTESESDWVYKNHSVTVQCVEMGPDGFLYSGDGGGVLHKVDREGNQIWTYDGHSKPLLGLSVVSGSPGAGAPGAESSSGEDTEGPDRSRKSDVSDASYYRNVQQETEGSASGSEQPDAQKENAEKQETPSDSGASGTNDLGRFPRFEGTTTAWGEEYKSRRRPGIDPGVNDEGVYVADVDGNGWEDVLFVGGDYPILYKNHRGELKKHQAFPDLGDFAKAAHFLDFYQDGQQEVIFLNRAKPPVMMRWEDGEYTEVDAGFIRPLTTPAGATSADLTGNGYQDLVVVQYGTLVTERVFEGRHEKIREMHPEIRPDPQDAYPNQFYEGSEDGFTRKTEEFGLQGSNWSLTASATDLTGDGRTDLHVANDFSADIVYENTGDGFQRRVLPPWSDRHAMASSVAHIYNRPIPEIFVTNIYLSGGRDRGMETQVDPLVPLPLGNNLIQYLPGKDKFVDRAGELGIRKGGWGWASVIADLNNSGRLDLIHATTSYKGAPMRSDDVGPWSNYQLWSHEGTLSKPRFVKREAKKYGFPKDESRGLVRIDLTGNGRLDLIASRQEYWSPTNRNPFIMFKNKGPVYSNFLQISLVDDEYIAKNARVRLVTEGGKVMRRTNNAGTDLLSQDSPIMHFGLGRSSTPARLEIDWHHRPGETVVKDIQKNRRFIVGPDGIRKSVRIEAKRKEDNREPEEE